MAPFNGVQTGSQQLALAMAPKVTGSLSLLGSSYIIWDCLVRTKASARTAYHRLMVGLSVCDLLMTFGLFTSTWFMPADTPNVWNAVGTTATCSAIGFIEQAGLSAVLYNASLSTFYLLRIRWGWQTRRFEAAKAEYWLHAIPILCGAFTMIAGLALQLFNSGLWDCWIAPYPQGCNESWRSNTSGNDTTDCIRGNNATLYQWVFDVIPKWLAVLLVTVNMFLTHRAVYQQEKKTLRYTMPISAEIRRSNNSGNHTSMGQELRVESSLEDRSSSMSLEVRPKPPKLRVSRRLARQSYLYVGALYLTYIPVIVTRSFELVHHYVYYEMLLTISIMIPLQGFWNVMVYLRPRYLQRQERKRKEAQRRQQQQRTSGILAGCNQGCCSNNSLFLQGMNFIREMSSVVVEGDLDNPEEDFENDYDDNEDEYHSDAAPGSHDGQGNVGNCNGSLVPISEEKKPTGEEKDHNDCT